MSKKQAWLYLALVVRQVDASKLTKQGRQRPDLFCWNHLDGFLGDGHHRDQRVLQQLLAGFCERRIANPGIPGVRLSCYQTQFFQWQQTPCHARGSHSQALRQVNAAQSGFWCAVEVIQDHEVAEAQTVQTGKCVVQSARQGGIGTVQAQTELKAFA